MRNIKVFAVVAFIALALTGKPTRAEVSLSLSDGQLNAQGGTMVISVENMVPVAGIQFDLADEGDYLAVDTVMVIGRVDDWEARYIERENGAMRVLAFVNLDFSTTPTELDSGNGAVFQVEFSKVEETSIDSVAVNFTDLIVSDVNGEAIESSGTGGYLVDPDVGVAQGHTDLPTEYSLQQNYPNPFNPRTNITFGLPQSSPVKLTIFNLLGQEVQSFDFSNMDAGFHTVQWNATNMAGIQVESGIYFYRIVAGEFVQTKKMVLLK